MKMEKIKEIGKCCISGKPLADSKHLNLVKLMEKAQWDFPVAGNVLHGQANCAVALIHDDFIDSQTGVPLGEIKFAVEFKGDEIIYHPLSELRRTCRMCGCWEQDACIHPQHGNCSWAEEDLCSHCKDYPGEATRYSKRKATVDETGTIHW